VRRTRIGELQVGGGWVEYIGGWMWNLFVLDLDGMGTFLWFAPAASIFGVFFVMIAWTIHPTYLLLLFFANLRISSLTHGH